MNHTQKVKLANRLLSNEERQMHRSKFLSDNWLNRRMAMERRITKHQEAAHTRALKRKEVPQPSMLTRAKARMRAAVQQRIEIKRKRQAAYALRQQGE